jgi:hypothetical protein
VQTGARSLPYLEIIPYLANQGFQQIMFVALTKNFRCNNDLMFIVNSRDTIVSLYHAFGCFHLGRFIVRDIALDRLAAFTDLIIIGFQPVTNIFNPDAKYFFKKLPYCLPSPETDGYAIFQVVATDLVNSVIS